jgi:hypothetical protein
MLNAPDVRPPGCLRKSLAHLVMCIDSPSSAFLYVSSLGPVSVSVSDLDDSLYFALGFSRVDGGGGSANQWLVHQRHNFNRCLSNKQHIQVHCVFPVVSNIARDFGLSVEHYEPNVELFGVRTGSGWFKSGKRRSYVFWVGCLPEEPISAGNVRPRRVGPIHAPKEGEFVGTNVGPMCLG